jgi:hypothetical protein
MVKQSEGEKMAAAFERRSRSAFCPSKSRHTTAHDFNFDEQAALWGPSSMRCNDFLVEPHEIFTLGRFVSLLSAGASPGLDRC